MLMAFAACGGGNGGDNGGNDADVEEDGGEDVVETGSVKTGMAVISGIGRSSDAGDRNGIAQADSTVVAVTVDENGVITNCTIDHSMAVMEFSADGKMLSPKGTAFASKNELGDDYGMRKASPIGREWNEQTDDLADYVIGKTLAEVKGIALTEEGSPADEDLASSVTVTVTTYLDAIEKAVNNAQSLGASAADKIGIGILTSVDNNYSKDASADGNGTLLAASYYAVVTVNDAGVVTSAIIDASEVGVNFTADGKIASDLGQTFKTKVELGDDYGMKKASPIGKEWNEQAQAFAAYVTGKSLAEIKGIAISEGHATDEDLASSVTVAVTPLMMSVEKAFGFLR